MKVFVKKLNIAREVGKRLHSIPTDGTVLVKLRHPEWPEAVKELILVLRTGVVVEQRRIPGDPMPIGALYIGKTDRDVENYIRNFHCIIKEV